MPDYSVLESVRLVCGLPLLFGFAIRLLVGLAVGLARALRATSDDPPQCVVAGLTAEHWPHAQAATGIDDLRSRTHPVTQRFVQ